MRKINSLPNLNIDKDFVISNVSSFAVELTSHGTNTPLQFTDVGQVLHEHLYAVIAGRIVYMAMMHATKDK